MTPTTQPQLRKITVWSGWLRFAHAILAVSTLLLIGSGWLLQHSPSVATAASEIHQFAATALLSGLAIRLWLLWRGKSTAGWRALWPTPMPLKGMLEMLKFYLSFGRLPLPRWYAHNPFWIPLYSFLLLLLIIMALSGISMHKYPLLFNTIYQPELHRIAGYWLMIIVCLHIITSIIHDAKGKGMDISAIINGERIFHWTQSADKEKNAPR